MIYNKRFTLFTTVFITFTTLMFAQAATTQTFYLTGESSEVSSVTNNAVVTPQVGPQGTLVIKGTGSVIFSPTQVGQGVSFGKGGQQNSNTAFYSFTGAQLGNVFNTDQGEVSFYLKSKYSFAERQALPWANYRFVFGAQDATTELYKFYFYALNNRLEFLLCH